MNQVVKVNDDTIFTDLIKQKPEFQDECFDFMMCNPPFYSDESEHNGTSNQIRKPFKRKAANSTNTACFHESIYDNGGEVISL